MRSSKNYLICNRLIRILATEPAAISNLLSVRDDVRIIRGCGYIPDEKGRECYTTVLEEYNTEVCACDTDGCNSASM